MQILRIILRILIYILPDSSQQYMYIYIYYYILLTDSFALVIYQKLCRYSSSVGIYCSSFVFHCGIYTRRWETTSIKVSTVKRNTRAVDKRGASNSSFEFAHSIYTRFPLECDSMDAPVRKKQENFPDVSSFTTAAALSRNSEFQNRAANERLVPWAIVKVRSSRENHVSVALLYVSINRRPVVTSLGRFIAVKIDNGDCSCEFPRGKLEEVLNWVEFDKEIRERLGF